MNPSGRSYFQLTLVAAVGLIFNFLSALFPTPIPQADERPNRLVIEGKTSQATAVDVFFDFGYGFYPSQLSRQQLPASAATLTTLSFPLPPGQLFRLRFDPTGNDQISYWEKAEIHAADGRVLRAFAPSDFIASSQVDTLTIEGERLKVTPTAKAFDTNLLLRLPQPIDLPASSSDGGGVQTKLLTLQRIVAVLLGLVGAILLRKGIVKRRAISLAGVLSPPRSTEWIILVYAALSILFFRRPSLFIAPQMFVEDGVIFFQQQWTLGWKALFVPYSGYLHLIPRLTTWWSSFFPISWMPALFFVVALAAVLATVLKAASPRVGFPFPYWCALVPLCLPNTDEILAFLTNVHWWAGLILLLVAVSAEARTRGELGRDLLAVVLAGLSGPWAVLCAPFFVFNAWRRRTRSQLALLVLVVAVGGVQMHFNQARLPALTADFLTHHVLYSMAGLGLRLGGQLIGYLPNYYWAYGSMTEPNLAIEPWELWALAGWLTLLLTIPVHREHRKQHLVFLAFALLMVASTVVRTVGWEYMLFDRPVTQRYIFSPLLLTIWLLILAVNHPGRRRGFALGCLLIFFVCNARNFRMPSVVDQHWSHYSTALEAGKAVSIPIFPAGWVVEVEAKRP